MGKNNYILSISDVDEIIVIFDLPM